MTCGEATIDLLEQYGVSTVFGIPGVHTLDICRGLNKNVRHIQARNELGAGFMAEGWARATGEPGVAIVISGPGVTNITTAIAQCYADSLPLLVISAEPPVETLGKGWGVLHEITEQRKVTEPITAFSKTVTSPDQIPVLMADAFAQFRSERPRPVHISIPIDVQAMPVSSPWQAQTLPVAPEPDQALIDKAVAKLTGARKPLILIGGGAQDASTELTSIADSLGAIVIASTAGKGIVSDNHPLSLSGSLPRPEVLTRLKDFDVVLAIGTELSDTESFEQRLEFSGDIIRIDIDPKKLNDLYPASIGIVADAKQAAAKIADAVHNHVSTVRDEHTKTVAELKTAFANNLSRSETQHLTFLERLRTIAPNHTIFSGDACQVIYSSAFLLPTEAPRQFFYPAGYCALGNSVPNAIGAKLAKPDVPVVALVGDGGVMFTVQELVTAAELNLSLPIIIWDNAGYKQIQDDMDRTGVERIGVEGLNPDFLMLARACHCYAELCESLDEFEEHFRTALNADRPTVIVVKEDRS